MKGEKFSQEIASSTEDKASYSPAMENLEKIVYLGLAGSDFPVSELINTFRYYYDCSIEEMIAFIDEEIKRSRDIKKNLNQNNIADYLDVVLKVDKGDRNFAIINEFLKYMMLLEEIDDSDYSEEYQIFKKLGTELFKDEEIFFKKITKPIIKDHPEAKFLYQPPSISYLPFFVDLYQILGGNFKLKAQEESTRKKEFYDLILEKFHNLKLLEIGCGPGFGLKCLRRVVQGAIIGVDTQIFPQQPPGIKILHDNILKINHNKNFSQRTFGLIFSSDVLVGEVLNKTDAMNIIRIAHEHLNSNGLQLHIVPFLRFSDKIIALIKHITKLKKQYPNEIDLELAIGSNSDIMMSRTLLFKKNEITDLAKELNAKVIKNEISNHHWVLALQK